ncbi:monovalent cation/H+ antiporter complex subunit F [Amycolatopsis pigmentata]|uniref:Monovalent cation/H+ antiporter complex subunit F n=1 Tax=Amycolatopsis pigmentata TaxID=450801 RepID=A0ABW5FZU4_9PSEU
MTTWLIAAAVLLAGGFAPSLWLASRGDPVNRLVGTELAAAVTVLSLLCLTQAYGPSSALILPLVLVVLSFAGTIVFTRLLGQR